MRMLNFELSASSFAVELVGLDCVWDLHNAGQFLGVNVAASDNTAIMSWRVSGHAVAKYSACRLVFKDLKLMVISPRDAGLPISEDLCVSGISKVVPGATEKPEYRTKRHWDSGDPFNLLFQFQSGRSIEVSAETVELVGIA
ncbi:MAG TPA: hypothetical protein VI488_04110 [Candidatus Angelobacter sp.]